MRNSLLLSIFLFLTTVTFGQDLVGNKFSDLLLITRHLKGIRVKIEGDTLMRINNQSLGRSFILKFDKVTHNCFQENITLEFKEMRNVTVMNLLSRGSNAAVVDSSGAELIYETSQKMIFVRPAKDRAEIIFILKKVKADFQVPE